MTRKKPFIVINIFGTLFLLGGIVLAVIATGNANIIGGPDLPTFLYVFFRDRGGLYVGITGFGAFLIFISAILSLKRH